MSSAKSARTYLLFLLYGLILYFPIFLKLDAKVVRVWDESRLTITAYEMAQSGNYLVPHFQGTPDMWSVKPPLMIWLQVVSIKLLGYNELAIRLPSALAALATCFLLLWFGQRIWKSYLPGFLAGLILITARGYVHEHGIRTGDYDALLVFLTTSYALSFYLFLRNRQNKFLYLTMLCIALAILTKGIAALLMLPGLFLYALGRQKLAFIFSNRHFYIGLLIPLGLGLGYYLLREVYNPGYLQAVWDNELGGRFLETLEGHNHPFWFYAGLLYKWRFSYWLYFLIPATFIGFFQRSKEPFHFHVFTITLSLVFMLIISSGQTKLEWYDLQAYPFFAFTIAGALYFLFRVLLKRIPSPLGKGLVTVSMVLLIFWKPYSYIFDQVYHSRENSWDVENYRVEYYLQRLARSQTDPAFTHIARKEYHAPLSFYLHQINEGPTKVYFTDWREMDRGTRVMASEPEVKAYIEEHYDHSVIDTWYNVTIYKIHGKAEG